MAQTEYRNRIEELEAQGFKVRVQHYRYSREGFLLRNYGGRFNPKGGMTIVFISKGDSKQGAFGVAKCSTKDAFDKRFGVNLAIARALGEDTSLLQKGKM